MAPLRTPRSARFLKQLENYEEIFILGHDHPDPDAVGSGWALRRLIKERLGKTARLVAGGDIVRAENRHMIDLLKPPLELLEELPLTEKSAVVLVDCSPNASNHLLDGTGVTPVAVLDHHKPQGKRIRIPFKDIRPKISATATIAALYLREQGIVPQKALATALIYAIHTETKGADVMLSRTDTRVMNWLGEFADYNTLSQIENAPLQRAYFADLLFALEKTFLYDNVALTFLPSASGAETVGEVADLLLREESVDRVLCAAAFKDSVVLSSRTTKHGGDATALLHTTLQGIGYCGGHQHRAGGKIPQTSASDKISSELQNTLRTRWLSACGIPPDKRGSRLVAPREIRGNI